MCECILNIYTQSTQLKKISVEIFVRREFSLCPNKNKLLRRYILCYS